MAERKDWRHPRARCDRGCGRATGWSQSFEEAGGKAMKKTITLYDGERHIHLFKIGAAELDIPELPDGIKVLGRGEHIVLPSSVGNTKSRLRFVAERGPKEIELAGEPPKWLSPVLCPSHDERVP